MHRKLIITILLVIIASTTFINYTTSNNYDQEVLSVFQRTDVSQIRVTVSAVNVRSGKGTKFSIVSRVSRGQILDVIGKLDDWYVVHLKDGTVGAITAMYVQPITQSSPSQPVPQPKSGGYDYPYNAPLTQQQQQMLNLINQERSKVGVSQLKIDTELTRVAMFKANDMVVKKYFSHTSPTYGSPFKMMTDFGINYRAAGENLAGNRSALAAHTALMNSSGHRRNILNPSFTHIGIGIEASPVYGYVFVQMFVGR